MLSRADDRGGTGVSAIPRRLPGACIRAAILGAALACQPTVKVQPPSEPITVNLNIKLDADVRVHLERAAREDIAENEEIF
jgi:hypothetical protein